jgi:hypothetical protein
MHSFTSALDGGLSFTLRSLYLHGKSPQYTLDRSMSGPQSLSRCGGEEKNSQLLPGLIKSPLDSIRRIGH